MFEEHFEKQATAYITVCVTNEWFVLTPVIIWRIMWYSFVNDEVGAEKSPPSANASPSSQLSAAGISAQSLLRCAPLHIRALHFRTSAAAHRSTAEHSASAHPQLRTAPQPSTSLLNGKERSESSGCRGRNNIIRQAAGSVSRNVRTECSLIFHALRYWGFVASFGPH